jgi:hypothetical protein
MCTPALEPAHWNDKKRQVREGHRNDLRGSAGAFALRAIPAWRIPPLSETE